VNSATDTGTQPQPRVTCHANFFASIFVRRQRQDAVKDSADDEVTKYLTDRSTDLFSLNTYALIKQLSVPLNTTLPASAAVE